MFIKTRDHNGNELVAYYLHNHLQAPLQAIDKQGNIRWAAQYTAFGQTSIISSGDSGINSNLRLPGQYADSESGLYYNWQRYYDPNTGRYISSDPIGLAGGLNRYAYVGGNPVGWVDPSGLNAAIPVVLAAICLRNPAGCRAGATILFCMAFPSLCTPPDPVNNAEPYKKDEADGEYCPEGSPDDKKLSNGEIDKLKDAGIDPHDLKPKKGGSKYDLFKDRNGNIIVKPKKGNGPGDPTGFNINNF